MFRKDCANTEMCKTTQARMMHGYFLKCPKDCEFYKKKRPEIKSIDDVIDILEKISEVE